jgi:mercuric reductase
MNDAFDLAVIGSGGAIGCRDHRPAGRQVSGPRRAGRAGRHVRLAATYAIKASMTVGDLADTWAPYLTMAESLRLVAGLFRNQMPTCCCA